MSRDFDDTSSFFDVWSNYMSRLEDLANGVVPEDRDAETADPYLNLRWAANEILMAARTGKSIFVMGNGGSTATANHFAADLVANGIIATSLASNTSLITALANDYGYDKIFSRQLRTLLRPNDVVVAFSASGESENVLDALSYVKCNRAITIAFTGFGGGYASKMAKISVEVFTKKGEYGLTEDIHLAMTHIIVEYLKKELKK